ncbi:MAG: hypothetical protein ACI9YL_001832 [Luteibaculaceae bacterium]|jgi:hypothetical protein
MISIHTFFKSSVALLMVSMIFGCQKEQTQTKPFIRFIQPQNDLVAEGDSTMRIILEAGDENGSISKVELFINEEMVKVFDSIPYLYDWLDLKEANPGILTLKAKAYNNKGEVGEAYREMMYVDYRSKFLGNYYFTVIRESWSLGNPNHYDTSYFHGKIRKFELIDREMDEYSCNDSHENPKEKITIEFKENEILTSVLYLDGELEEKTGYHYGHGGNFIGPDSISFSVGGFGGNGGGWGYDVFGKKE